MNYSFERYSIQGEVNYLWERNTRAPFYLANAMAVEMQGL